MGDWLKGQNIPRTNAWEAMELFRLAETVEAVADLTLTQAKQKFGITKPPKNRTTTQPKEKTAPVKKSPGQKLLLRRTPESRMAGHLPDDDPHPEYPASACQGESQFAPGRSGQSAGAVGVPAR